MSSENFVEDSGIENVLNVDGLVAHSPGRPGVDPQTLVDHSLSAAQDAARFAPANLQESAALIALLHDVGKAAAAWQSGIGRAIGERQRCWDAGDETGGSSKTIGYPHKEHGADWVKHQLGEDISSIEQLVMVSHHGGLQDIKGLKKALTGRACKEVPSETGKTPLIGEVLENDRETVDVVAKTLLDRAAALDCFAEKSFVSALTIGGGSKRFLPVNKTLPLGKKKCGEERCVRALGLGNCPSCLNRLQSREEQHLAREFAARMLFSALIDADHSDAAAYQTRGNVPFERKRRKERTLDATELRERFDRTYAKKFPPLDRTSIDALSSTAQRVIAAREKVYQLAEDAAELDRGLFTLCAPTGSGKTLAMLRFALRHAEKHNLDRIIVALPFLSVTEQSAQEFREFLESEGMSDVVVLEHHSQFDLESQANSWEIRQATQNWNAPVIVTTSVQLLESLFGNKGSAARKNHRMARSVIMFDEVQSLPHDLLPTVVEGMGHLCEKYGSSVVFASATIPPLEQLFVVHPTRGAPGRTWPLTKIVSDEILRALEIDLCRVSFEFRTPRVGRNIEGLPLLTDVVDEMMGKVSREPQGNQSGLMIVNTTRAARVAYNQAVVSAAPDCVVFHLSSRMVPEHRRFMFYQIQAALACGVPVVLASTQAIEAGVDLDFGIEFREYAPITSILQGAGRCNRNGNQGNPLKESGAGGKVVVFDFVVETNGQREVLYDPYDEREMSKTREYLTNSAGGPARTTITSDDVAKYYRLIFPKQGTQWTESRVKHIHKSRRELAFESLVTGADAFKLIQSDDTASVFVVPPDDTWTVNRVLSDALTAGGYVDVLAELERRAVTAKQAADAADKAFASVHEQQKAPESDYWRAIAQFGVTLYENKIEKNGERIDSHATHTVASGRQKSKKVSALRWQGDYSQSFGIDETV